jgi:hypothetical protein
VGHGQVGLRDSDCPGVGLLDDVGEGGRHLGRECEVDVEEAREQFPQRRPIGSDFARGRCGGNEWHGLRASTGLSSGGEMLAVYPAGEGEGK